MSKLEYVQKSVIINHNQSINTLLKYTEILNHFRLSFG